MEPEPVVSPNAEGNVSPTDRNAMPVADENPPRLSFPVVGIGASAGGLEAFLEFFKAVPPDTGIAYVVIQHLPPERESMITTILAKHTPLPVQQVEDGIVVEPNHVYVIRPGRTMTIANGALHLGEPVEKPGHRRPVDDFFRSLAAEQRERAICVIMSGMGSNGTAGAEDIKAAGGVCIAQDPESAKFPSMPRNLVESGLADFVLRPAEIPELLVRYAQHPYASGKSHAEIEGEEDRQVVSEILTVLRTRLKIDFSGYKKATILRRIQRRMGLHQVTSTPSYARLLRQSPGEVSALSDDLMIHVTGFFRDPEIWEALRQQVIVPLVEKRADDMPLRAWVTACSSGEEAYTLGILLLEAAELTGRKLDMKIFATDTAERSLGHARTGIFPGGIESEIAPERLERFFERDDANYRVKKELRELVVFAPQNILQDPPFSRLDICTCRNLLIYLEPEVQRRALALMHFGLREGGTLLLGASETIVGAEELFEPLDKKHRIFRRVGPTRHGMVDFPLPTTMATGEMENSRVFVPRASFAQMTQQALVERFGPPAVVVDRQNRIAYFHGATDKFLDQPRGEPTRDVITLCREWVRGPVRAALQRAMSDNESVTVRGGLVETPAGRCRIEVTASVLDPRVLPPSYFLVSFVERPDPEPLVLPAGIADDPATDFLHEELRRARQDLQSTVEELQTSNEEMKASNEEAMSINEELQSTNEELETSKEELQSLNEELVTVNTQLQSKMEELEATTNDLSSLLSSTSIAVIFLDHRFRVRRFTPAAKDLIDLIPADVGRPLSDLARKFKDDELLADAKRVLDTLVPRETEIRSDSGRVYVRRVLPYRTKDNRIEGIVVTFIDIADRKEVEEELRANERRHRIILEGIKEYAIFMLDPAGRIVTWTPAAERVIGFEKGEALGQRLSLIYTPEDQEAGVPDRELELAAEKGNSSEDRWHLRRDGSRFWGTGMLYALKDNGIDVTGFVKVLRDNTDHKRAQEVVLETKRAAELANEAKDQFLANVSHELRTPLTAMLLWSKLLAETEALDPQQLQEGLQAIKRCAEEQQALIEDLVDTSRIAAGKLRLERATIPLIPMIRSAVEALRPAAVVKGLTIDEYYEPAVGLVRADPHRLHQVVWNLLTNAAKFTPLGGRIGIRVTRTEAEVEIQISDTGEGISAEFLPRVFERFHQGGPATTRIHGGLGLGLSITRQLVELHEGTITAKSGGIGRGATFTVRLPLPVVVEEESEKPGSASPLELDIKLGGLKVLLVEDAADTRRAVTVLLQDAQALVIAAESAPDALKKLERVRPDVIVSDIGLPGMDGFELLRRVREWEKSRGESPVPALALTAYADEGHRRKAFDSGFRKCLTKPVNPALLLGTLAKLKPSDPITSSSNNRG